MLNKLGSIMSKKELVDIFVAQNDVKKYILGRTPFGKLAKSLLKDKGVEIVAYIDQNSFEVEFDDLPVIHNMDDIPENSIVLNGVVSASPCSAKKVWKRLAFLMLTIFH